MALACPVGVNDSAELLLSRTDAEQGRKACLEIASFAFPSYHFHILYHLQCKSFSFSLLLLQPLHL